jgi:hypothetical protein
LLGLITPVSRAETPDEVARQMKPYSGPEEREHSIWSSWQYWMMAAGVTLLAVAAGSRLAVRVIQRTSQQTTPAAIHQRAIQELGELEKLNLPARGEFERHYVELSNIVRHYLEQRFRLNVTTQTTDEFLEDLKTATWLANDQRAMLREFLEQCDLVKFAGLKPTAEQSQALAVAARRLVEQTAPESPRKSA